MSGITGTDGQSPIYDENGRWTNWSLKEIYTGGPGAGRFVPKVNDYVTDFDTDKHYKVTQLNPSTFVPTLKEIAAVPVDPMNDRLLGVGPGTLSDTYRMYVDKTVLPHVVAIDFRCSIPGNQATKCQVFIGSELDSSEQIISRRYNGSGELIGTEIPLELVSNEGNISRKIVPVFHTTYDLKDRDLTWAVFYSEEGHVVSKRQLIVEESGFIPSLNTGVKYVTAISLKSPFLSSADPHLLQYPLNVPLSALNLLGVVEYSDGSRLELPVDNTKFSMMGFESFVSSVIGMKMPLVLKYQMSPGEASYGVESGDGKFITDVYQATTVDADGAYTVKLFCVPIWVSDVVGWRLDWYLYNLDRNTVSKCTNNVYFAVNTAPFDPIAYGINQRLQVSVNLRDVNGSYKNFTHTQIIDLVLMGSGTLRSTNWTIAYEPNQSPRYGINLHADTTLIDADHCTVKVSSGFLTQNDWLQNVYRTAKPLVDITRESAAPEPTHFALVFNNKEFEYPISSWNATLSLTSVPLNASTLGVKFFKRTLENDIQLAMGALPVWQTN